MAALESLPSGSLTGQIEVPGDKSISHRALMIGASAAGVTRITGLLESADVMCTAAALRTLGITLVAEPDAWYVHGTGVGGLAPPDDVIDCGNAGTAARLLLGLLASHPFAAHMTGDPSLRGRPMSRVTTPLAQTGAVFEARRGGRLPILVNGAQEPLPLTYEVPVPSAQVKSAILLAALNAPGLTTVTERTITRDHTENLLRAFGAEINVVVLDKGGQSVSIRGYPELAATDVEVPGDPSSAAFPGVAATVVPGSEVVVKNVGINPLRTGFLSTLRDMGAEPVYLNRWLVSGEPAADIAFRYSPLRGVDIPSHRAPSMIDEYPIIAAAAAFATGTTRLRGVGELRVKESDRFAAILRGLNACGVAAWSEDDDILVRGCGGAPPGNAVIATGFDHRIAMSFLVLGAGARNPVSIDDGAAIGTSFPGFVDLLNGIGGCLRTTDV